MDDFVHLPLYYDIEDKYRVESTVPGVVEKSHSDRSVHVSSSSKGIVSKRNSIGEMVRNVSNSVPASSSSSVTQELFVKISHRDFIEHILAHLSTEDLMRSRLVCHEWDAMVYDKASRRVVLDLWAKYKPLESWILFHDTENKNVAFFDVQRGKWRTHCVNFGTTDHEFMAITSARGLVFMYSYVADGGIGVRACNPLSRKSRRIPPLVQEGKELILLSLNATETNDERNLSYTLVAIVTSLETLDTHMVRASDEEDPPWVEEITYIYDSDSNSWRRSKYRVPRGVGISMLILDKCFVQRFRSSDQRFFLVDRSLMLSAHPDADSGYGVLEEFALDTGWFASHTLDNTHQFFDHPEIEMWPLFLFERDGTLLLLVIELDKWSSSLLKVCANLRIWTRPTMPPHGNVNLEWTILSTMPDDILLDLHLGEGPHLNLHEDIESWREIVFCTNIQRLKCFAVGGEVPDDDQLIFIAPFNNRVYSFKLQEPVSQQSWRKIYNPESRSCSSCVRCHDSSGRSDMSYGQTWLHQRVVRPNVNAPYGDDDHQLSVESCHHEDPLVIESLRGSQGFCFTPRPDVEP